MRAKNTVARPEIIYSQVRKQMSMTDGDTNEDPAPCIETCGLANEGHAICKDGSESANENRTVIRELVHTTKNVKKRTADRTARDAFELPHGCTRSR